MKKALVIIRTSTKAQEIEAQRKEVIEWAISDGYTLEEIAVVGQQGASAIKLDEAYLANLQRVYDTINTEPIECVYAWAIDRIARKVTIFMEFKDLLVEKGINLKIKNPTLVLLNDDRTVNSGVEIAFSLFATMAKQEMEQKQARFARARKYNAENEIYNGGAIQFGYEVVNSKIVPNVEDAEQVRLIFNLYASGNYSTSKLAKELNARGLKHNGKLYTDRYIATTLKTSIYKGGKTKANTYPAIISEELWNKCAEVRKNLTITPSKTKESKHIHLALGLLKCSECGRNYTTCDGGKSYVCTLHAKKYLHGETCSNNIMISTKVLDGALWNLARLGLTARMIYNNKGLAKESREQIEVLEAKIVTANAEIERIKERTNELQERYFVNGELTKERYNLLVGKNEAQITTLNADVELYKKEIIRLEKQAEPINVEDIIKDIDTYTEQQKKDTIAKLFKEIHLSKINYYDYKTNKEYKATYITTLNKYGVIESMVAYKMGSNGTIVIGEDLEASNNIVYQTKKATFNG